MPKKRHSSEEDDCFCGDQDNFEEFYFEYEQLLGTKKLKHVLSISNAPASQRPSVPMEPSAPNRPDDTDWPSNSSEGNSAWETGQEYEQRSGLSPVRGSTAAAVGAQETPHANTSLNADELARHNLQEARQIAATEKAIRRKYRGEMLEYQRRVNEYQRRVNIAEKWDKKHVKWITDNGDAWSWLWKK